jgi:hypothetical protein
VRREGWPAKTTIYLPMPESCQRELARHLAPQNDERLDLFRDRGARAALPQNCSPRKLNTATDFANGTPVPAHGSKVPHTQPIAKQAFSWSFIKPTPKLSLKLPAPLPMK